MTGGARTREASWGFNADPQLIPDLDAFVQLVRRSFEEMAEAVEVKLSPPEAFPLEPAIYST